MLVLGIETSGAIGGVALVRGDALLAEEILGRGLLHGRHLVPALAAVFRRARREPAELDLVAVTRGPGSHTGLRIGLMAAKTLARTLAKPAVGVCPLEALCHQAPPGQTAVAAALDARLGKVFGAVREPGAWTFEPALCAAAEFAARVPAGAFLTGSGVPTLAPLLGDRVRLAPEAERTVKASSVAFLGARAPHQAGPPEALEAVYFQ